MTRKRKRENRGGGRRRKDERISGERIERTERGRNRRKKSERLAEKITNRGGVARDAADVARKGRGAMGGMS